MSDPGTGVSDSGVRRRVRGSGCATALGAALILIGAAALLLNLYGAGVVLVLIDLIPIAAVWWPALLIVWGLAKIAQRLATGRARFGVLEVLLLIVVLITGLGLSAARVAIERHGLALRLAEVQRWAHEQAEPLPQHAFVVERTLPLPAGDVELAVRLDAGGITVAAVPEPSPPAAPPVAPEAPGEAAESGSEAAPEEPPRELQVRLEKRVWARTAAVAEAHSEEAHLIIGPAESGSDGVRRFMVEVEDRGESNVAFDLWIDTPPGVRVSAVSGQGPIRVEGPFARVSVESAHGPVEVLGAAGEVRAAGRDGSLLVSGSGGPVSVRARRAVVEVEAAGGPVSVESEGAPVWVEGAAGPVTVESRGGAVTVVDAAGEVRVDREVGPVTLRNVSGPAWVRGDYGPVLAVDVRGALEVRGRGALVEVRGAGDAVELYPGSGDVLAIGVAGELNVATEGGDLFAAGLRSGAVLSVGDGDAAVEDFAGPLQLVAGDGSVRLAAAGIGETVSVSSRSGDVRLELPAAGSFELEVDRGEGSVESDFELAWSEDEATGTAVVGDGGPRVRVSTVDGEVRIEGTTGGEPPRGGAPDPTTPEEPEGR